MKPTWKTLLILAIVAGLIACLGAIMAQKAMAQAKPPADYTFNDGAQGKVLYSHKTHVDKGLKCTDCHTKVFKMSKPTAPMKMADMNNGQECGACHNGQKAFSVKDAANCAKCHKKG